MVSNSFLTGGGGFSFENSVQAMALIDLACGSFTRVFSGCPVQGVCFQTNRLGYATDDMMIRGEDAPIGKGRRLLYQIKHGITFTKSNAEWTDCIRDFWQDFNNPNLFSPDCDAFVVAVARLSLTDVSFANALESLRLGNAQSITKAAREKLERVKEIIDQLNGNKVPNSVFEQFVSCIHVLEFGELDTWESVSADSRVRDNPDLWREASELANRTDSKSAFFTQYTLPPTLIQRAGNNASSNSITALRDHSRRVMRRIKVTIADKHVHRTEKEKELGRALDDARIVFVTGDAGTGKSALVKSYLAGEVGAAIIWLTSEDLSYTSLEEAALSLGGNASLQAIANQLSLNERVVVVVDSMERQLQGEDVTCLGDLLDACHKRGWYFIGILRSYSFSYLPYRLDLLDKVTRYVALDAFSLQEVADLDVVGMNPNELLSVDWNTPFLRKPYVLSMLSNALVNERGIDLSGNPPELRRKLWDIVVERRNNGSPVRSRERGRVFEDICVKRASTLAYTVSCGGYDQAIIDDLLGTDLLKSVGNDDCTVSHDMLEDWGVFHFFDSWYTSQNPSSSNAEFLSCVRNKPGLGRAFTTWLGEQLASDSSCIVLVRDLVRDTSIDRAVRRFCITAVIESERLQVLLDSFDYGLFAGEDSAFALIVSTMRLCAVDARPLLGQEATLRMSPRMPVVFVSRGSSWEQAFAFASKNIERLDRRSCQECVGALKEWSVGNARVDNDTSGMRAAGLLALQLLEKGYDREDFSWAKTTLASVATSCFPTMAAEYRKAVQLDTPHNDASRVAKALRRDAVFGLGSYSLASDDPELLCRLVRLEFFDEAPLEDESIWPYAEERDFYGLSYSALDHCMAHGRRPPFFGLFRHAPMIATHLCVEICNRMGASVERARQILREVDDVSILKGPALTDGWRSVLVSLNMWCAYRGMGNVPPHVQSMLMSLENCLIDLAEADEEESRTLFNCMYDCVLSKGETALTLGVAASLAMGFPGIVGDRCLPLFSTPELFFVDSHRMNEEGLGVQPWPSSFEDTSMYEADRVPSNKRAWRTTDLERLCVYLQLSRHELLERILGMIDSFSDDDDLWLKGLKARIDSRGFTISESDMPGAVLILPPRVDVGKEAEAWHNNYVKAIGLSSWGRSTFDGKDDPNSSLFDLFQTASDLAGVDDREAFRGINMFCAAVVRAGLLDSGPSEMHQWCCERILDACAGAFDGSVDVARMGVELSSLDYCLEVVPLLLNDESESIRCGARHCILEAFLSDSGSISVPIARGIAAFLWDIDSDFARELIDRRKDSSPRPHEAARKAGVRFQGKDRTVLLTACPASHDQSVHEDFKALFLDAIAAERYTSSYDTDRYRASIELGNDAIRSGPAGLIAKYLFDLKSIAEFAIALKKGTKEAPVLLRSILVYLAAYCADAGALPLRWAFVETIVDELVEIALASPNDASSAWADLIRRTLYGDADWQPLDYERQDIRYGKATILDIASKAGSNVVVFESLAHLMFHFPEVFSVECMDIISGIDDKRIEELFERTSDAMFCIVAWMRTFVLRKKDATITRGQYDCCLRILNSAVESGSPEAYFVRNSFINRRWTFRRV